VFAEQPGRLGDELLADHAGEAFDDRKAREQTIVAGRHIALVDVAARVAWRLVDVDAGCVQRMRGIELAECRAMQRSQAPTVPNSAPPNTGFLTESLPVCNSGYNANLTMIRGRLHVVAIVPDRRSGSDRLPFRTAGAATRYRFGIRRPSRLPIGATEAD
jgi:hypothetical protein